MFKDLIDYCNAELHSDLVGYVDVSQSKCTFGGFLFTITAVDVDSNGCRFFNSRVAQWLLHNDDNKMRYVCGNLHSIGLKKPSCRKYDNRELMVKPIIKFLNENRVAIIEYIDKASK